MLRASVYLIGDLRLGGDLRLAGDRLSGGRGGLTSRIKIMFFQVLSSTQKVYLISQPAHSRGLSTTGPFRGRLWSGDRSGSWKAAFQ